MWFYDFHIKKSEVKAKVEVMKKKEEWNTNGWLDKKQELSELCNDKSIQSKRTWVLNCVSFLHEDVGGAVQLNTITGSLLCYHSYCCFTKC